MTWTAISLCIDLVSSLSWPRMWLSGAEPLEELFILAYLMQPDWALSTKMLAGFRP